MKKCPYCGEENQDAALKCKYCKERLPETNDNDSEKKPSSFIWGMILIVNGGLSFALGIYGSLPTAIGVIRIIGLGLAFLGVMLFDNKVIKRIFICLGIALLVFIIVMMIVNNLLPE